MATLHMGITLEDAQGKVNATIGDK